MSSSLPPIDSSMLPADVRTAGKQDQTTYKTAMAFERQLVEQLTQQLADTSTDGTGSSDDGSGDGSDGLGGTDAVMSNYQQMLPGVMADSIMQAGGLGLARTIAQSLKESGQ